MRMIRYIEKLRQAFEDGAQPALARIHLTGSGEVIEDAELLRVGSDFVEIGHGGFVTLIPESVIARISVYDRDD